MKVYIEVEADLLEKMKEELLLHYCLRGHGHVGDCRCRGCCAILSHFFNESPIIRGGVVLPDPTIPPCETDGESGSSLHRRGRG